MKLFLSIFFLCLIVCAIGCLVVFVKVQQQVGITHIVIMDSVGNTSTGSLDIRYKGCDFRFSEEFPYLYTWIDYDRTCQIRLSPQMFNELNSSWHYLTGPEIVSVSDYGGGNDVIYLMMDKVVHDNSLFFSYDIFSRTGFLHHNIWGVDRMRYQVRSLQQYSATSVASAVKRDMAPSRK